MAIDKKAGVVKFDNAKGLKKLKSENKGTELVIVQAICKNVHIEGGVILNAFRKDSKSNWKNGDYAAVPKDTSKLLIENEQAVKA